MFIAKDFVETAEGLVFAVVAQGLEQGKVLCFLRYRLLASGPEKLATEQANCLLRQSFPEYLHHSTMLDADLHAVAGHNITCHHQPRLKLQAIKQGGACDAVEHDLVRLCELFAKEGLDLTQVGVTGSLLLGAQNPASDIDLVCYGREVFQQCRAISRKLIQTGELQDLHERDWRESYRRRNCDLSYDDYLRHERRKFNKALINGRKFDLSFIDLSEISQKLHYRKLGKIVLQCRVTDDSRAFDYPAEFKIDHESIYSIVSYTATYAGQAAAGERVEVSGMLEQSEQGQQRIVVGSSREAHGEYIKVVEWN